MSNIAITVMGIAIIGLLGIISVMIKEVRRIKDEKVLSQRDSDTLIFIHSRLANKYGEKTNIDYMIALKRIATND